MKEKNMDEIIEQQNLDKEFKCIIWGEDLEGAGDNAIDLEIALTIGRDVDGVDIPGDTPKERQGDGILKQMNLAVHDHKTKTPDKRRFKTNEQTTKNKIK